MILLLGFYLGGTFVAGIVFKEPHYRESIVWQCIRAMLWPVGMAIILMQRK